MKKAICIVLLSVIVFSLVGCGCKAPSKKLEENPASDLISGCTKISMCSEYDVQNGVSPETYEFYIDGDVARFEYLYVKDGAYTEYKADFTLDKFDELKELILNQNPKLYDISNSADKNGKINYETLKPAYLIDETIKSNGNIQKNIIVLDNNEEVISFFKKLKDNSELVYSSVEDEVESSNSNTDYDYSVDEGRTEGYLDSRTTSEPDSTNGVGGISGTDSNNDTTYVLDNTNTSTPSTSETSEDFLPDETITER